MPRGENPNSKANLNRITEKEAREKGKKGGIASGKVRGNLKSFREMDMESTTPEERLRMLERLKQLAMHGNLKALEMYLKIIGEYSTKVEAQVSLERDPFRKMSLEEIRELIEDA